MLFGRRSPCVIFVFILTGYLSNAVVLEAAVPEVKEVVDVERVWSGHVVGFALLTQGSDQFIAYYDAQRRMTVAHRELTSKDWTIQKLDRKTGWDSHNYITMALDREGHLHLSGDMHCVPMCYFRTKKPGDIRTLERVKFMVGPERERRVTYPVFTRTREGDLVFRYRDGSSGNGSDYYNVYNEETRQWRRLVDEPLVSGEGKMNAYCTVPERGPDGFFHMVWVWRDTPDAKTNHDLSYARSRNLKHWETGSGKAIKLPMTISTADIVDPVPARGGMINGNTKLGFDPHGRPVITYHKYDENGNTQIYNARLEDGDWQVYQTSDWDDYRWDFGGGGAIPFDVRLGKVKPQKDGTLVLSYRAGKKSGTWVLDEKTLKPIPGREPPPDRRKLPRSIRKVESDFAGMHKRFAGDIGGCTEENTRYVMTWETLGRNRDRPRKPPLPKPSMLRVVKLMDRP